MADGEQIGIGGISDASNAQTERDYDAEIDSIWPSVVAAFGRYGRTIRDHPGPSRRKIAKKRLAEGYEPSDLVRAIHGYVHFHGGLDEADNGFTPRKWFDPDSVWKATRFETRVELGERPWVHVDPRALHEQRVREKKARAEARLEAARSERDRRKRIRAV